MTYRDFFISRAGEDAEFAKWIGRLIAAQGKSYILQDEHFGHEDFMVAMHKALSSDARVVALYSQAYLNSKYCLREATETLKDDPANERRRLVPLRIEPCAPSGMLNVTYTDLRAERRQADAKGLALKILDALGFDNPSLAGIPPPPEGALERQAQITPEEFRLKTDHLAPRDALIAGIAKAMHEPAPARGARTAAVTNSRMLAVHGIPGVGKTVLALAYARRHAGDYHGIGWIRAETRQGLLQGLAELGARIEPGIAAMKEIEKAAARTLAVIEQGSFAKPWLIIYDNVEKPGDLDKLTPADGAHMLITTRWSEWYGLAGKIDVRVFSPEQAVEFLCERAGSSDREGAAALAEALGYLPLALDHAASYCRTRQRPFATYLDDVARLIKQAPTSGASFVQYPGSVYGTFRLALERIIAGDEERGIAPVPEAGIIMGISAYLAPDAVPRALLDRLDAPSAGIDDALAGLSEVSLVTLGRTERGTPAFSVHRLVQLVAADLISVGEGEDRQQFLDTIVGIVDDAFPWASWDWINRAASDEVRLHAEAALGHARAAGVETPTVAMLAQKLANLLQARAQFAAARRLLEEALQIADATDGAESEAASSILHDLAVAYQNEGRYAEAEPLLERALAICKQTVGPEHLNTSGTMRTLGGLYQARGRYSEAEPLLKRALAITEESLGAEAPDTSAALHGLASLYQAQGRYSEAEPLLKKALGIAEKTFGPAHPNTSAALHGLASLHQAQGRYNEAEPLLTRSLAIKEGTLGAEHPDTSGTLHALAGLYQDQGRYSQAEPLLKRSLAMTEKAFGAEHPNTVAALHGLARLCRAQGRYSEAEPLFERSLAIREKTVGPKHPDTAATLHELAYLFREMRRTAEAEPLINRALSIYEKSIGPEHPTTAMALDELARLHLAHGRVSEAELLLKRALPICERAGGVHYMGWILDLAVLVGLSTGQPAQAEAAAQRALALRCANLPADHPEIARSRWTLARVLIARGEAVQAEPLLRQAIAALEAKVAEGHAYLEDARQTLAGLHRAASPSRTAQAAAPEKRRWRLFRRSGEST